MAEAGLQGVIEEPFGAALCLFLIGFVFARRIYRMNLLTIGDFYRNTYGPVVEWTSSFFMVISFIGWIAAQFVALGVLFNVIFGLDVTAGTILGFGIVTAYTAWGGMWSVAVLDFVQNAVIIVGLLIVTTVLSADIDLGDLIAQTPENYFQFLPESTGLGWLNWFAAWITIGLGSIPGQDIYQRVMSSRNEQVARNSSLLSGVLYLTVGLMPLFLAMYIRVQHPQLVLAEGADPQTAIPQFILGHTPAWVGLLFLGALLSAVLSSGSGGLMAPSAILSENLLPRLLSPRWVGSHKLTLARISVVIMATISLGLAVGNPHIHDLALESSAISLVSLFAILVAGMFFRAKPTARAAMASMLCGMGFWVGARILDSPLNPILWGLGASFAGLLVVYALPGGRRTRHHPGY
jgi:Na+/proline symporter